MYSPKRQINLDISNKCGLACPACDRQSLIRNKQKISEKSRNSKQTQEVTSQLLRMGLKK